MKIRIIFIVCLFGLVACSDPNEATEDNFITAIENEFSENHACIKVNTDFPEIIFNKLGVTAMDKKPLFNEFVKFGLLSSQATEKTGAAFFGKAKVFPATQYDLTEKGKSFLKDPEYDRNKGYPKFCYGRFEVVEIENFTVPGDTAKESVTSKVDYTFKLTDIADWARSELIAAKYREINMYLQPGKEILKGTLTVKLTNNGWVVSGYNGMRR